MKRLKRSFEILMHGLVITLVTYVLYPNVFIRFGILHFLALGTLLILFLAPHKILSILVLIILSIISYPKINSYIDLITGANSTSYMMDWFPLNNWLPILLLGLIIGQNIPENKISLPILQFDNFITDIGKNSLNLYTIHLVVLLVFYKVLNNTIN
jgi:hypothetical protein